MSPNEQPGDKHHGTIGGCSIEHTTNKMEEHAEQETGPIGEVQQEDPCANCSNGLSNAVHGYHPGIDKLRLSKSRCPRLDCGRTITKFEWLIKSTYKFNHLIKLHGCTYLDTFLNGTVSKKMVPSLLSHFPNFGDYATVASIVLPCPEKVINFHCNFPEQSKEELLYVVN